MFDSYVLLLVTFKCDGRPVVLILYIQCTKMTPSSLYSLVCDVPQIAPVMAGAGLY